MPLFSLDEQQNRIHKPMMEGKSLTSVDAELIDRFQ